MTLFANAFGDSKVSLKVHFVYAPLALGTQAIHTGHISDICSGYSLHSSWQGWIGESKERISRKHSEGSFIYQEMRKYEVVSTVVTIDLLIRVCIF